MQFGWLKLTLINLLVESFPYDLGLCQARATQHKLQLAQNATQESLERMLQLAERFSAILYADDDKDAATGNRTSSVPVLTETLGQHARKLKADTIPLLKALRELRAADPLGAPLYSHAAPVQRDTAADDADEDGVSARARVWESREGYLNWEADRIITKSKRAAAAPTSSGATASSGEAEPVADATLPAEDESKTPKRKRTAAATGSAPTSSKRKTPGTASRTRS